MKHSDVEELARKAGCGHETMDLQWVIPEGLEHFAALVLEKAAENHDEAAKEWGDMAGGSSSGMYDNMRWAAQQLAEELRAMSAALQSGDGG